MDEDRDIARPREPRVAWIDWLRLLALAGVFVVHVSQVFNPWDAWHVTNAERSRVVGEAAVLFAPWVMPLLMLLAGVGAWHSLAHRTNAQYVRERAVRLLVPLVVGVLVLVPPQVWAERRWRGQFDGSLLAFYPHAFSGGLYPSGNLSWHHLWFLAHLFAYAVVTLPLFRYWRGARGREQMRRIARLCGGRAGLLWLALPLLVERHLAWVLQGREARDWSGQSMLLVTYVYGFVLAGEPALGRDVDAQWRRALVYAALSTLVLTTLCWFGIVPARLPPQSAPGALAFWTAYAVGAWAWVVALLGAGRRYLHAETRVLARARRDGYAWYLLHQTVIVVVAARVVTWHAGIPLKLATIAVVSLAATLGGAALLAHLRPLVAAASRGSGGAGGAQAQRRGGALSGPAASDAGARR